MQTSSSQIPGKRDLSISMLEANLRSLVFGIAPVFFFALLFWLCWGGKGARQSFEGLPGGIVVFLVLLVIGIVSHEAIHGLSWAAFGKKPLGSISFGFNLKALTPFAHINEPLEVQAYRIGTAMPAVVLGFIPCVLGVILGQAMVMGFGLVFVAAAGGDLLILWLIRKVPAGTLVEDHPTRAGCYLLEPGENR